jgi:DNA-binding response OmpR family regulator
MSRRVLVVDDEPDVLDFVRLVLEAAGYEVACCSNGRECLRAVTAHPPDLIVLDLMMPVMDGWSVLSAVGHRPPPLIVVLSAAADPGRAREMGAAATLAKPFNARELLAVCRRVLGD